jgi:hypothetical protein
MQEEPDSAEWKPPAREPEKGPDTPEPSPPLRTEAPDVSEPAQMSEVSTLGNIFFEPGRTFEDLRRKPRFIMGFLIIAILSTAYIFALNYKVGEENTKRFVAEQIDKSPQGANLTSEQRAGAIALNMKIGSIARYAFPVLVLIAVLIGALLYWLGAKAFGGSGGFLHAVSVWIYSSLPPAVLSFVANILVLVFKSVDEIDLATSQRGVVHANPSMLIDGKGAPVLATLLGTFDLFLIWGWILAAIGLRITNKISSGSAWALTIILALVGLVFKVIGAYFSGNPA